jgi:HSP20 family molecular chaperone IbpA
MSTVSRERRRGGGRGQPSGGSFEGWGLQVTPVPRLRDWRYQTRPSFKRVRGPLVDVFHEAEEVLIIVDLGGFTRGEISVNVTPQHYIFEGTRGEQRFREVIDLPPSVDIERSQERLVNGVLEIVLPRRKVPILPARRRATRER